MSTTPAASFRRPRPAWRRRAGRATAVAVLGVVVLAGCTTDNTPKAYNDVVRTAFVAACTGNVPPIDGVTTTISSTTYCECAYQVFADNVPYNKDDKDNRDNGKFKDYGGKVFVDLEGDLKDDPNKIKDDSELPKSVRDQLDKCPKQAENVGGGGTTVPATPGSQPPGTVAGPVPGTEPTPVGSAPPGTAAR